MKTHLFFFAAFLLLPLSAFGFHGNAGLQIDFDHRNQYLIEVGYEQFFSRGSLTLENLSGGFYPITISRVEGRKHRVVYAGGVNLAPSSVTYASFYRGNLIIREVVPFFEDNFQVMNDREFSRFMRILADESFDSSKVEMLEFQLPYQYFTAAQVASIMDELSFESSKLKFAKLAFAQTIDPRNYYLVRNKLNFNSSKEELTRFISGTR